MLCALVGGCGEAAPSAVDDMARYSELVGITDPAACAEIGSAALREECISMAAAERAKGGDLAGAQEVCTGMTEGFWRDECHFLVADAGKARGPVVAELCKGAGHLRNQCFAHALDRELAESRGALVEGEEAAFEALMVERFGAFLPSQRARGAAHVMVAGMLADRNPGAAFSRAQCGDATEATCTNAFVLRVEGAVSQGICLGRPDPHCAPGAMAPVCAELSRTSATAVGHGLPGWEEEVDDLVQPAWVRLCDPRAPALSQGAPGTGP